MQRNLLVLLSLVAFVCGIVLVIAFIFFSSAPSSSVCYKENCFEVELSLTAEQHASGLSNRDNLLASRGMLFVFESEGEYPFWMKDMKFPLDIVWISANGTVVFIQKNALPCDASMCVSINPGKNAKYVLELNANKTSEIQLSVSDKLDIYR